MSRAAATARTSQGKRLRSTLRDVGAATVLVNQSKKEGAARTDRPFDFLRESYFMNPILA